MNDDDLWVPEGVNNTIIFSAPRDRSGAECPMCGNPSRILYDSCPACGYVP